MVCLVCRSVHNIRNNQELGGSVGGGDLDFKCRKCPQGPVQHSNRFFFFIIIFESVIYIRVGFFFFKNKRQKRNVDRLIDVDMWANNMR